MRCVCCDSILRNQDTTTKIASTGEYADMCKDCRDSVSDDVDFVVRNNVEPDDFDDDDSYQQMEDDGDE